jgi:hypothetical protein
VCGSIESSYDGWVAFEDDERERQRLCGKAVRQARTHARNNVANLKQSYSTLYLGTGSAGDSSCYRIGYDWIQVVLGA